VGAILGSLVGGFGLLPALSAPGAWKMVVLLLCVLGVVAGALAGWPERRLLRLLPGASTAALAVWLLTFTGPTAYWRHSQIGVGRLARYHAAPNDLHDLINAQRRQILWETDGVESSVAMTKSSALAFVVNGKIDGNTKSDAGTQVMSGLIGAALHPQPTKALVIGLGTGSTAGWLAAVPSIRQVDVFELEPAIVRVATECAAVNHAAMANPKVKVAIGDGRESLLTGGEKYDLIVSEPSNPYRAGLASLFTVEYYQSAARRLEAGGFFLQWMQIYELDPETLRTVYATFGAVFPQVETWQTTAGDLLLVGSKEPIVCDVPALRSRLSAEPFRSGMVNAWRAVDLEGFLAHHIADASIARAIRDDRSVPLNTDDRTVLEFAFAKGMALRSYLNFPEFCAGVRQLHADRPAMVHGEVDWTSVDDQRISAALVKSAAPETEANRTVDQRRRAAAFQAYANGDLAEALHCWQSQPKTPQDLNELTLVAECLADAGDSGAIALANKLKETVPADALAIVARLLVRTGRWNDAAELLEGAFSGFHQQPWSSSGLLGRTINLAPLVAEHSDPAGHRLFQALQTPFSSYCNEDTRVIALLKVGVRIDQGSYSHYSLAGIEAVEPNIPWQNTFLKIRAACYRAAEDPRAAQAARDFQEFTRHQTRPLSNGLRAGEGTDPSGRQLSVAAADHP
jgi:spermidine synthase